MSKTPYELRAELLHLAFNVCSQNRALKSGDKSDIMKEIEADEIIKIANKFNEFVSSKNDSTKGSTS